MSIQLKLLGPPLIQGGGEQVSPGPKASALLAYLAVEGLCSREQILGQLWPESTQKKAQQSLRYLLHSLKKQFPEILQTSKTTLCLGESLKVDLRQLQSADSLEERVRAAGLRQGVFCEGVYDLNPDFDQWLTSQRERWDKEAWTNLIVLARLLPPKEATEAAREAVRLNPLEEESQQLLLKALMDQGKVAEAHQQLEHYKELLLEELGIEPEAGTLELVKIQNRNEFRSNVPLPSRDLIGRDECLQELVRKFAQTRLLTLVGEGGIGKTSLAKALGNGLQFTGHCWFAELAEISSQEDIGRRIALSCGAPENEDLITYLKTERAVIVLDNCEHLAKSLAPLVASLLSAAPDLRILATSRVPLRVAGETVHRLAPLEPKFAVELLRQSAQDFGVDERQLQDSELLYDISERLDNLPLALELAAGRMTSLSLEQLAKGLEKRFRLLKSKRRDVSPRQENLISLIEWSYERLTEDEKKTLRALSVFKSGCQLDAISAVLCLDAWEASDFLEELIEKSLVRTRPQGTVPRFYCLESIREFAQSQVTESAEGEEFERNLSLFYASLIESLKASLKPEERKKLLTRLDFELTELQVFLNKLSLQKPSQALSLTLDLEPLWKEKHRRREGLELLDKTFAGLEIPGSKALLLRGELQLQLGKCEEALLTFGLALQAPESRALKARAHKGMGSGHLFLLNPEDALREYELAEPLFQEDGADFECANCFNNKGLARFFVGDYEEAKADFEQALELYRELGKVGGEAVCLGNIGAVLSRLGELGAGRKYLSEALEKLDQVGNLWSIAYFLEVLAYNLEASSQAQKAIEALSVAERMRQGLHTPRLPAEVEDYQALMERLRASHIDFEECWLAGESLEYSLLYRELL